MANTWVYLLLIFGCLLTCVSSCVLVCRWVAIPFHGLLGIFAHILGIVTVYMATSKMQPADYEYLENNNCGEVALDAEFLKQQMGSQWILALIFTFLVNVGCY